MIREKYQIVAACQLSRQREIVRHPSRLHDLVRPLSVSIIELVDFVPGSHARRLRCIRHWSVEHVGDGAGMSGLIPLDLDAVASFRSDSLGT